MEKEKNSATEIYVAPQTNTSDEALVENSELTEELTNEDVAVMLEPEAEVSKRNAL